MFGDLTDNRLLPDQPGDAFLSKGDAIADIKALEEVIRDRHSYVASVAFPYGIALRHIGERLPEKVSVRNLALQVQKFIQYLGDSHAMVLDWKDRLPSRYSPVAIGVKGNLGFGYWPERRCLLDADHPYIRSLDGLPLFRWLERAGDVTSGVYASRSQRLGRGLDLMRYAGYLRLELGLPDKPEITFELTSPEGRCVRTVEIPLADTLENGAKPFHLPTESRVCEGNVGYLRLYSQNDKELAGRIDELMQRFRDTASLIIDVRQCGGGTRDNLNALFPYLMKPEDGSYIPNVAKLRVPPGIADFNPVDQLKVADKAMSYCGDVALEPQDASALTQFLSRFTPQWRPPEPDFTDWYFSAFKAVSGKPHYDRPVYILMDWGVGSAGDIFVSTFKGWRNVTLVGSPTNGRSGNSIPFVLEKSGITARLSTMASFQKTGQLFDGVGVTPDIDMEPEISDWLGETDSILQRVMARAAKREHPL